MFGDLVLVWFDKRVLPWLDVGSWLWPFSVARRKTLRAQADAILFIRSLHTLGALDRYQKLIAELDIFVSPDDRWMRQVVGDVLLSTGPEQDNPSGVGHRAVRELYVVTLMEVNSWFGDNWLPMQDTLWEVIQKQLILFMVDHCRNAWWTYLWLELCRAWNRMLGLLPWRR